MNPTTCLTILIFTSFTLIAQKNLAKTLKQYNKETIPYITTKQLEIENDNYIYLDAREFNEYNVSHLPGAIYVGYKNFSKKQILEKIANKNTRIVLYCSIGVRSEQIGEKIQKLGYTNVYNLYGGIFEFKNSGRNIYNSHNKLTDSVHTYNKEWSVFLKRGIKVYEN